MSIQTIINGLNATFNKNVQILLKYCNSAIKSTMNSILSTANKNNNIKKIQNYFNRSYKNLKNKLNLDIKAAHLTASVPAQVIQVKKNALLIGCNYIGTEYELGGCINDVENIQNKLRSQYGFNNILIMSDNTSNKPTKVNILNEIKNLLSNATSGDKLFLSLIHI